MTCASSSSRSRWVWPLTVAAVPTGINAGVWITPCGVVRRPRRAPVGSVARTSKRKLIRGSVSGERSGKTDPDENNQSPQGQNPKEGACKGNLLRRRCAETHRQKDHFPEQEDIEGAEQCYEPLGRI